LSTADDFSFPLVLSGSGYEAKRGSSIRDSIDHLAHPGSTDAPANAPQPASQTPRPEAVL
jgi:hypothetical protein